MPPVKAYGTAGKNSLKFGGPNKELWALSYNKTNFFWRVKRRGKSLQMHT